jgi:hypothetical protein
VGELALELLPQNVKVRVLSLNLPLHRVSSYGVEEVIC